MLKDGKNKKAVQRSRFIAGVVYFDKILSLYEREDGLIPSPGSISVVKYRADRFAKNLL